MLWNLLLIGFTVLHGVSGLDGGSVPRIIGQVSGTTISYQSASADTSPQCFILIADTLNKSISKVGAHVLFTSNNKNSCIATSWDQNRIMDVCLSFISSLELG